MCSTYPGLIGLWHLNDGTGTTSRDFSSNGNGITFVAGGAWSTGKFGTCFVSDGTSYFGTDTSFNLTLTSYVTVGAWIYPTATIPASTYPMIMDKANYRIYLDPSSDAYTCDVLGMVRIGGSQKFVGVGVVPVNRWSFVVMTYDKDKSSQNMMLYINGKLVATTNQLGVIDVSGQNLRFAWQSFFGRIDECMVFNRAISAGEIKYIYDCMSGTHNLSND